MTSFPIQALVVICTLAYFAVAYHSEQQIPLVRYKALKRSVVTNTSLSHEKGGALKDLAHEMFLHGYDSYMTHAFPKDDLNPLACTGSDSQGGISLTLIDSLDSLILLGEHERLCGALSWLKGRETSLFRIARRVHVFELTIRALGGLLSAHVLLDKDPDAVLGGHCSYDGFLLRMAQDLGDRLLPAFDTPTGLPLSWVDLETGVIPGDTRETCTACAGTLYLEWATLSHLTGNPTYESRAFHAVQKLYSMRSAIGLVGSELSVDTGGWVHRDTGIGAGIDSYYEYLLKSYFLTGNSTFLDMFADSYAAATLNLQMNVLQEGGNDWVWLLNKDMETNNMMNTFVWALSAFWPGLQVMAGQLEAARSLHSNFASAWEAFGWLPEMFDLNLAAPHPSLVYYVLRPELMESTYMLYAATRDEEFVSLGSKLLKTLNERNRAVCGFAGIANVQTGQLIDKMESFFLAETVKYLYLLFSSRELEYDSVLDQYVISTEAHFLSPIVGGGEDVNRRSSADNEFCKELCTTGHQRKSLLPGHLPHNAQAELRHRRCAACVRVSEVLQAALQTKVNGSQNP